MSADLSRRPANWLGVDAWQFTSGEKKRGSTTPPVVEVARPTAAPKIGDLIQWTVCGADQFATPRRVASVDDYNGGVFVFVEGSDTGLPIDQVTVVGAALPPRPPCPPRPRVESIPAELRALPQWVLWRYIFRDGKWTKLPFQPGNPARAAKANIPSSWGSIELALRVLDTPCDPAEIAFDGIGFEFSKDDPYFGVDVDNCLKDGEVLSWAQPILEMLEGTYGEISPSGNGVKFIAKGKLPGESGTRRSGLGPDGKGALEVYDHGRFFTITGNVFGDDREVPR